MAAPNIAKSLARIKVTVESGAFYEAQQMYKSTYHRHKARGQLAESRHILQEGAVVQLSHQQVTCGVELGMMLVEAYVAGGVPADEPATNAILSIVHALPGPGPSSTAAAAASEEASTATIDEGSRFVTAAVKWAHRAGAPDIARRIHSAFATYLWTSYGGSRIGRALLHFIRGSDARGFAEAIDSCSIQGPASEVDLWLLRALLQALAAASSRSRTTQLQYARELFADFTALRPSLDTPAVHCAGLLLVALEHGSHELFCVAQDRYGAVLRRDSSLGALVTRVEQTYFNVAPPGGDLGGLLGGLLSSLGGLEDMDDE